MIAPIDLFFPHALRELHLFLRPPRLALVSAPLRPL